MDPENLPGTASRLISLAASLVGGTDQVKTAMGCSTEDFHAYCAGRKEPPWLELDRLTTLIMREQQKAIAQNRERLRRGQDAV